MAKKSSNSNFNSKYNRYQQSNNKKKTKKGNVKEKSLPVDQIENLDSTQNLDISFVEGKKNIKKTKNLDNQVTEILDVDEVKKANLEFNESLDTVKNRRKDLFIKILLFLCFSFLLFIVVHFITVDHKVKFVEKEIIKEVKVVDDNYLFLGDSITQFYDLDKFYGNLPVINSGVSGYTTEAILDNLNTMAYQYNPSKVFLLIGINDLELNVDNETVVDNIKKIIHSIQKNRPYSKIYLESIYPINNSSSNKVDISVTNGNRNNEDIKQINKMLEEFSLEEDITYIDLYSKLVGDDGLLKLEYTVDGLHISDEGYQVITDVIKRYIEK